jgi:glycosyltransferase involved in cell wall biosynthesis
MVGYYSADSDLFLSRYKPLATVPKRFVYVGRLLDIKGTPTLLKALEILNQNGSAGWEFLIIGSGVYEQEVSRLCSLYPNVTHKAFMQPDQLAAETASGGVFILPSNYDAWGVVVHEFALMGYPLILSSMVGSRHYFVTAGYNGFVFESQNPESLANAMRKMISLNDDLLTKMSERSHLIGKTITTESWAARLVETVNSHYSN